MKSARIVKQLSRVAVAALALGLFAGYGKAQSAYQGKFTLPFQAEWGGAVLPAGDYTMTLQSATFPYEIYLRGEGKSVIILSAGVDSAKTSDQSQLTLVSVGGRRVVTSLQAGQIGLVLNYPSIHPKKGQMPATEVSQLHLTVSPVGS